MFSRVIILKPNSKKINDVFRDSTKNSKRGLDNMKSWKKLNLKKQTERRQHTKHSAECQDWRSEQRQRKIRNIFEWIFKIISMILNGNIFRDCKSDECNRGSVCIKCCHKKQEKRANDFLSVFGSSMLAVVCYVPKPIKYIFYNWHNIIALSQWKPYKRTRGSFESYIRNWM